MTQDPSQIHPYASLCGADLCGADLSCTNLSHADLCDADLCDANLRYADLRYADLRGADLRGADLSHTDLCDANLRYADLRDADLRDTNLRYADLRGADLRGTCLDPAEPIPPADLSAFEIRDGWAYGWRTATSQHCGETEYVPGQTYTAPLLSRDVDTKCHPGIYLAPSAAWLAEHEYTGPYVRCRARVDRIVRAGDKYRTDLLEMLP